MDVALDTVGSGVLTATPLEHAANARRALAAGGTPGKIVITIG
ncbi:hypothetical protein [Streptomyces violaceusniger]|nr:hypothetical protein [Streptomyces hygroscopicus]